MKKSKIPQDYLDKAAALSREEAERLFSRMHGKLQRKLEKDKLDSLEAVALQLLIEDEDLQEWRQRYAEMEAREVRRSGKEH